MTPHSVIFHIHGSFAGCTYEQSQSLQRFLDAATVLCRKTSEIEVLAQGVWLIPLRSGLPYLGQMVVFAQDEGIAYRTLFLEDAPDWFSFGNWA